jgi:hypothetical protein
MAGEQEISREEATRIADSLETYPRREGEGAFDDIAEIVAKVEAEEGEGGDEDHE